MSKSTILARLLALFTLEERLQVKMTQLDDKITELETNYNAFKAEVSTDVATMLAKQKAQDDEIAALQAQLQSGGAVTQEQLDRLGAISTDLTNSTVALHQKVTPQESSSSSSGT